MGMLRKGVCKQLEDEANRLLRDSLKGVYSHRAKSDLLTPWKEAERRRREIYVSSGVPDPMVRKGMFHRKASPDRPHLNSREGVARADRWTIGRPKSEDEWENGYVENE